MQSGVIIMGAFTKIFFLFKHMAVLHLSFFFLNESNMKSTEAEVRKGNEY